MSTQHTYWYIERGGAQPGLKNSKKKNENHKVICTTHLCTRPRPNGPADDAHAVFELLLKCYTFILQMLSLENSSRKRITPGSGTSEGTRARQRRNNKNNKAEATNDSADTGNRNCMMAFIQNTISPKTCGILANKTC